IEATLGDVDVDAYEGIMDALDDAGARDMWTTPVMGRRGRARMVVSAVTPEAARDAVISILRQPAGAEDGRIIPTQVDCPAQADEQESQARQRHPDEAPHGHPAPETSGQNDIVRSPAARLTGRLRAGGRLAPHPEPLHSCSSDPRAPHSQKTPIQERVSAV